MKKIVALLFLVFGTTTSFSQENENPENTGVNFSLEGALAMFKKANSLKNFERIINDKKNNVNNLDLNDDGEIDYINVDDIKNGDSHILVLSTYLSETEKQDIATISIEKTGEAQAVLQIEGDNNLYAENTIIEPTEEKETLKELKDGGPNAPVVEIQSLVVNVWFWPCVSYIYAPQYVIWKSPYRWSFRPNWWRPWHPYAYKIFYVRCAPHRLWYRPGASRRVVAARNSYTAVRHTSTLVVRNRKNTTIVHEKIRGASVKTVPVKRIKIKSPAVKRGSIKGIQRGGGRR
ncbi:M73 family metallopeptidase [Flavobacterium phycosphaerae]|uniref:hypothetical protein n=1 Tax=Flavobacterium phycosphaerae TaxID=2697515 RepID=UPI00138A3586|nr:hypothetical protein [Flavobacterium phycosphaerae]